MSASSRSICFARAGEELGFVFRTVAEANAFIDTLAEEGVHGVAVGDGVVGEFVAEVGELKPEALGDCPGVGNCFG